MSYVYPSAGGIEKKQEKINVLLQHNRRRSMFHAPSIRLLTIGRCSAPTNRNFGVSFRSRRPPGFSGAVILLEHSPTAATSFARAKNLEYACHASYRERPPPYARVLFMPERERWKGESATPPRHPRGANCPNIRVGPPRIEAACGCNRHVIHRYIRYELFRLCEGAFWLFSLLLLRSLCSSSADVFLCNTCRPSRS